MTDVSLKTLCTALGFTAIVMMGDKIPKNDTAHRATSFAHLIESFCLDISPDAPTHLDKTAIDAVIKKFKQALNRSGSASLPQDRTTLIAMYDRLLQRRARRTHRHFYETAHDSMIANAILGMLDEELNEDGGTE